MLPVFWITALAATFLGTTAVVLPTPAPEKVCSSLMSGSAHRTGWLDQDGKPSVVELSTSVDKFRPGQNITDQTKMRPNRPSNNYGHFVSPSFIPVSLNGRPDVKVQGFAVQAREIESSRSVGTFVDQFTSAQIIGCDHPNDTIVSIHGNVTTTRHLNMTWTAPNDAEIGDVEFIANVRQVGKTSWASLKSRQVRQIEPTFPAINMTECGTIKGCFRYGRRDCTADTCSYAMSYRADGENVTFELAADTDGWVAVGFSSDQRMNGDDVLACVNAKRGRSRGVVFRHYWNFNNNRPDLQDNNPIVGHGGMLRDGRIYCRFSRLRKVYGDNYSLDLDATWFFLYAWGPASDGNIMRHTLDHPPVSYRKIIITSKQDIQRNSAISTTTVRIHLLCLAVFLCQLTQQ